jgi:glycosyltransferase involved in cell wall biosynthesis
VTDPRTGADGSLSISVILAVRNGADLIGEALASVGGSNIKPSEILVVDGGSSDETVAVAERFEGVTIVRQHSKGIANAYNEGIARAKGDLLAFISHDDHWIPGKLDRQVAFMKGHPEYPLSVTHVQHYLEPGGSPPPGFRRELLEKAVPGLLMETLMVRPLVFERVGGFDPSFEVGEDTDWFARVKDAGIPIGILPETLTMKRVHGSNTSLNSPRVNALLLKAMRRSIDRKRGRRDR